MHEGRRESNNAPDRLNLGYLYHIPGLCGNPDGPGCVQKSQHGTPEELGCIRIFRVQEMPGERTT